MQSSTPTEPNTQATAFEGIVKQSAEKLTPGLATQAPTAPKRVGNPGGPRGPYKRRKKFSKRIPLTTPHVQPEPSQRVDAPTPEQSPASGGVVSASIPMPDTSALLVAPLKIVSRIPARKYQVNELALNDTEALELAQSINQVVQVFFPDLGALSPKAAAAFNFGAVASTLILTKYQIYSEKRAEIELKTKENELKSELNQELNLIKTPPEPTNPSDFFKPRATV